MQKYLYTGFGLNIFSSFEFPELQPSQFESADVTIEMGKTPAIDVSKLVKEKNISYLASHDSFFFEVAGLCRFYAVNGSNITIELLVDIDPANLPANRIIRLYLLATVFCAVLLQREWLPLHASAVIRNKELYLIMGHSGAGKSTVLASLIKKGYTVFSDDITIIKKIEGEKIFAHASYPMIKLWNDTIQKLDDKMFAAKNFMIREGMDKYGFFFHDQFDTKSYPISSIIILQKTAVPGVNVEAVPGANAFIELTKQMFRPALINSRALRERVFTYISTLANNCTVYKIERSDNSLPELLQKIETLLAG